MRDAPTVAAARAPLATIATVEGFPAPAGQVDLVLRAGDVLAVRGANGSGKTSLLRALAGLPAAVTPRAVRVLGQDPRREEAPALAAALATQDPRDGLVGLTVEGEFRLRGRPVPDALGAWSDRTVAELSSGEARRVGLAAAAALGRPLLLLDEPEEGLDAAAQERLGALVRAHAAAGGATVLVDHGGMAPALATRVLDLGGAAPALPPVRRAGGPVVAKLEACEVRRGAARIRLPDISLGPGLHAITGPNGSGKSTALLALAGALGAPARIRREPARPGMAGVLLPRARDLLWRPTVADELAAAGGPGAAGAPFVPAGLLARHPDTLSGGEAQRVALAKALAPRAPLYLLDEPEAHLDPAARALLAQVVDARVAEGACVVMATHDLELAALARTRITLEAA